ncbi:N-acetylglucosamine-6-phosphate deacetylase [Paenibacillus nasutitermitis]|uniref:N-acetylglucosamine-6-phosphate deacetylase n=1 Tax=Paenibacillus nasutitermitis TaxID=1652958 RepID=A0A916YVF4_9BACL|nr:N-acetylglucosamine-6-phosphate deacetylase [Paenibacillus nasutitermitis]GGD62894.1 N-acetylglucosamine-6-phosphate deacetylase [Paenibacillus nasutitermitis]
MSSEERVTVIRNGRIVTENNSVIEGGTIVWQNQRIVYIGEDGGERGLKIVNDTSAIMIDADGGWVLPGFIDVHVHGGAGYDFMEATTEAYDAITRFHARHGTTGMLATTVTAPRDALTSAIHTASVYRSNETRYAELLGVHLEGPFISPQWSGAQNPEYIVAPQLEWIEHWVSMYPALIRILTLAPELDGASALIAWLNDRGIIPACGHTDASYDCMNEAAKHGLRHAVHSFNAMRGMHHREPGTVGAILTDDRISAEIIADGHHVHPAGIRMLTALKRSDQVILITDAISAAGLEDGSYRSAGLDVIIKDSVSRTKEGGQLAGSMLTMIKAFQFMAREVGLKVEQVSRFASGNPALLLGLDQERGSLAKGKLADLLILSADLELQHVFVRGRPVH